jgi:hypothetical protein
LTVGIVAGQGVESMGEKNGSKSKQAQQQANASTGASSTQMVDEGNHAHAGYVVVFDIADVGYKSYFFPAFGLILVAIGVVFLLGRRTIKRWSNRPTSPAFPYVFLCFAILWTLQAFITTYSDYRTASSARQNDAARVVEGVVTDFKPMPAPGKGNAQFCVSGVCFYYSDNVVTAGFNQTNSSGGPIREGLPVRVTYVENTIVKLEVAESSLAR